MQGFRSFSVSFSKGVAILANGGNAKGAGVVRSVCFTSIKGSFHADGSRRLVHLGGRRKAVLLSFDIHNMARRVGVGLSQGGNGGVLVGRATAGGERLVKVFHAILFAPSSLRLVGKTPRGHHQFVSLRVSRIDPECCRRVLHCNETMRREGTTFGRTHFRKFATSISV